MENIVFTQLSIPEFRKLLQQELEQFHKNAPPVRDTIPDEAAPPFVTKREAARLISVCASTIDNAARAGRLKRHYVGKTVRFEREQVLALAKAHTNHKQKHLNNGR